MSLSINDQQIIVSYRHLQLNPHFARFARKMRYSLGPFYTFALMNNNTLPVGRLNRLTFLLSAIIGIIFHIIISHNSTEPRSYVFTIFTVVGVILVGFTDVYVMEQLARFFGRQSFNFKILRIIFTYPASILIYFILWPIVAFVADHAWSYSDWHLSLAFVGSGIVINMMIMTLHDSVVLYEYKLHSELEISRLRTANAEAANLLLRQQIQPHFLFNALNTLKALYHSDTAIADHYIVHMASFLRASVSRRSDNITSFSEEFELLNDYLAMQRIRFGTALDFQADLSGALTGNYYLPSFSLQPLLENAIKHNNFTEKMPLRVRMVQQGERLIISNNIQRKSIHVESTNYGLANLVERYRLCSGDEVFIKQTEELFSVSIRLLKNENSNY